MTDRRKYDPQIFAEYKKRATKLRIGNTGRFLKTFWAAFESGYTPDRKESIQNLRTQYANLCGKPAYDCVTLSEFFCKNFSTTLEKLFAGDTNKVENIRKQCAIAMECPYAHTNFRPSYRSAKAGDYADAFFSILLHTVHFYCLNITMVESMDNNAAAYWYELPHTLPIFLALALRENDQALTAYAEEAILGDNSQATLNYNLIKAIFISGDPHMLDLLAKLLIAAKGQEGIRQSLLENCDSGTIKSHIYFLNLILEHNLCRFSATIRAFGTWSGLAYTDQKQKVVEKGVKLARDLLTNVPANLPETGDTVELYMYMWAMACRDVNSAITLAQTLITSEEKYKRLVGWYFITHTANNALRHRLAVLYLHVRDPEELAWVCGNLFTLYPYAYETKLQNLQQELYMYPQTAAERAALFDKLEAAAEFIGKRRTKFTESVFPWYPIELNAHKACKAMLAIVAFKDSAGLITRLAASLPVMESFDRSVYYKHILDPLDSQQREILLAGLADKGQYNREGVAKRLMDLQIIPSDISHFTKTLTTKNAQLRKVIMTLLEKQNESLVDPAITKLLYAKDKNQLIAGVELVEIFAKKNTRIKDKYTTRLAELAASGSLTKDIEVILGKIDGTTQGGERTSENGFGLYNPNGLDFDKAYREKHRPNVPKLSDAQLQNLIMPNEDEVYALYKRLAEVFARNKDYEYEADHWDGSREKILLGHNTHYNFRTLAGVPRNKTNTVITDYPLASQWLTAAGDFAGNKTKLAVVLSIWAGRYSTYDKQPHKWFLDIYKGYPVRVPDYANKIIALLSAHGCAIDTINSILRAIYNRLDDCIFDFAFNAYVNLVQKLPDHKLSEKYQETPEQYNYHAYNPCARDARYLTYWKGVVYAHTKTDAQFTAVFNEYWYIYLRGGLGSSQTVSNGDVFRALHMGLISQDVVFYHFTSAKDAAGNMRLMTTPAYGNAPDNINMDKILVNYPAARGLIAQIIDIVVEVEASRGELPTELSAVAANIHRYDGGIKHFVNILTALGKVGFSRSAEYRYMYNGADSLTKLQILSRLLRVCRPTPACTAESLAAALTAAKINKKRAMQAAIYAPAWAELLGEAMDISGLKSGVWFFHAHVAEHFSAEKETEVALFSEISPQQFNDGTFDKAWFLEAYETLGVQQFDELYKNAKYISNSNVTHRRSQLYADAVLGRLNKDELQTEIVQKRNQEKLRAFALIPLVSENDALQRYEFIQQFKKESRQFGSARQASEGKAVAAALENLAITTGYGNTDRMTWAFEGAKMEQLRHLLEAQTIGEYSVCLQIDSDGTPAILVQKSEKTLKSTPKELAKNEIVLEIKDAVKQLKDQKRHARYSLEAAMIAGTEFPEREIVDILEHPVLSGMISALVFTSEDAIGFPSAKDGVFSLVSHDGEIKQAAGNVRIAHPCDFVARSCWSEFQKYVFTNKITQPFKQVFREYYPLTEDERAAVNMSRRYAGYQVQPGKTLALLKTRGWTVDYEEGLQHVWLKENIVVRMYALANWFSPSEVEAPTLEGIQFFRRNNFEAVPFEEIPATIFSETMRDIDMVVSVAHVGGVDPEASFSTIEMRTAIAGELVKLLGVTNVTFQTAHAQIAGSLGEYSVHMGSGVVHKQGKGMIAILPVHSQARGRIFLPFADDDPKTAEIMSKILLLADDGKIKDVSILRQL